MDIKELTLLKKGSFADIYEKDGVVYKIGKPSEKEILSGQFELLSEINNPHFVTVYKWFEDEDLCGFTMEKINNPTIDKIPEIHPEEKKEFDRLKKILNSILNALFVLHSQGIMDGDLKPSHIFVTEGNNVKIIDPGYDPSIITPIYASPEAIVGDPGLYSDIYSLGIILYEVLTGEKAFKGNLSEIIEDKFKKDLSPPKTKNKNIPEELNLLVQRMTAKSIENRLLSVNDVKRELEIGMPAEEKEHFLIPVFAGRKKELEKFDDILSKLPESHLLWIVGEEGMGKTEILKQFKIKSLIKGLEVREISPDELYRFFTGKNFSEKPLILILDNILSIEDISGILKENARTIRFHPLIILITSEYKPKEIEEISDITSIITLPLLDMEEIGYILDKNFINLNERKELILFIKERSNGIPTFVNQILSLLIKEKAIEKRGESWIFNKVTSNSLTIPKSIEDYLTYKIKNLSISERKLLKFLSIFPGRIPLNILSTQKIKNPFALIQILITKKFLRRDGRGVYFNDRWTRDFFYKSLDFEGKEEIYNEIKKEGIEEPEVLYPLQIDLGMKNKAIRSLLEVGKKKIKGKDYPSAINLLKKSLSLKENKITKMVLSRLYELTGEFDRAMNLYKELLKKEPDNPYFLLKLGSNEWVLGEIQKSLQHLKKAIDKSKKSLQQRAIYELGFLYLEEGKLNEASSLLSEFKGKLTPRLKYLSAHLFYLQGEIDKVIKLSEKALEENLSLPLKRAFLNFLGLSKQKNEEYPESIKYFDECLKIDGREKNLYNEGIHLLNKGFSLLQIDQSKEALENLETALSISKNGRMRKMEERILWTLSILYLRLGYWEKLEERINEFKKRYGEFGSLLKEKLIYSRIYIGDLFGAEKLIGELKEKGKDVKEAEGILASFKEEWEKAEEIFKALLKKEKGDLRRKREISWRLAEVLYYQGKGDEAITIIQPSINKLNSIKSKFEKAQLLSTWGIINKDISSLNKSLKLFSELGYSFCSGRVILKKGEVHIKNKEFQTAVGELKKAEDLFSKLNSGIFLSRTRKLLAECAKNIAEIRSYPGTYDEISKLLSSIDSEKRFDETLSILTKFFNVERGAIILRGENNDFIVSSFNTDQYTLKDARRISSTITGRTAKGEVIVSGDATHDPRFQNLNSVNRNKIKSILCVPIIAEEKIYGVLYLDSSLKKNLFLPSDKEFLQSIGRILGLLFSKGDLLTRLREENTQLREMTSPPESFHSIIGISQPMQEIYKIIEKVAPTDLNFLIMGETGTGKELVARTIHKLSKRKNRPFVMVDCSSLSETLLQSELFGHKKGSFTGAINDKKGLCESANGGTLFLDEIGDAPRAVQAGLLHVTDRGEIRRVGETEWRKVDLRIISATNKDLDEAVALKEFREDLYYRLNQIKIKIQPLRERKDDIPLIAEHYLKVFMKKKQKEVKGFKEGVMDILMNYPFPGNVRELKNIVEVLLLKAKGEYITERDLPPELIKEEELPITWNGVKSKWEREVVQKTFEETQGNIKKTAEKLQISRRHLYRLLKKYEIKRQLKANSST